MQLDVEVICFYDPYAIIQVTTKKTQLFSHDSTMLQFTE